MQSTIYELINGTNVMSILAIVFSVGIAIWVYNRGRQVLTYQNLIALSWDKDYLEARKVFIKIRDNDKEELIELAKSIQSSEDMTAVRSILNWYEIVAQGIESKILDEKMVKDYYKTTLITDYKKMMPFIEETRRLYANDSFYIKFQALAKKWNNNKTP